MQGTQINPNFQDRDAIPQCGRPGCRSQGDSRVFKRYSPAKLMMMREALEKLYRKANEHGGSFSIAAPN
jgi:hypothetical protein